MKPFHRTNFLFGDGLILGAGLSLQLGYLSSCSKMDLPFIYPRSWKEALVYRGLVRVTCIICNDVSLRSRLAPFLSKMWPLKRHNQPINALFRRMLDLITLKYATMICKSQICLKPICPVGGGEQR